MNTIQDALKSAGVVADLREFEEAYMEDDSELTPIQRRLILRRIEAREKKRVERGTGKDVHSS